MKLRMTAPMMKLLVIALTITTASARVNIPQRRTQTIHMGNISPLTYLNPEKNGEGPLFMSEDPNEYTVAVITTDKNSQDLKEIHYLHSGDFECTTREQFKDMLNDLNKKKTTISISIPMNNMYLQSVAGDFKLLSDDDQAPEYRVSDKTAKDLKGKFSVAYITVKGFLVKLPGIDIVQYEFKSDVNEQDTVSAVFVDHEQYVNQEPDHVYKLRLPLSDDVFNCKGNCQNILQEQTSDIIPTCDLYFSHSGTDFELRIRRPDSTHFQISSKTKDELMHTFAITESEVPVGDQNLGYLVPSVDTHGRTYYEYKKVLDDRDQDYDFYHVFKKSATGLVEMYVYKDNGMLSEGVLKNMYMTKSKDGLYNLNIVGRNPVVIDQTTKIDLHKQFSITCYTGD